MKKLISTLMLVMALLLVAQCSCNRDPVDPQHYWVTCQDDGTANLPMLTNGKETHYEGQIFDPTQYRCPDTGNSPIWSAPNATYNTNGKPKLLARNWSPKALGPASAAYLPQLLLDLPFPAQRAANDKTTLDCDPAQPDIFQVNHDNASVNRIATCPFKWVATIPVVSRPLQVAVTPDASTVLVTSFDNALNFIDPSTNRVISTLMTPNFYPNGLAISPDGAFAYIVSFTQFAPAIAKIDLATRKIVQTIPARGAYPQNAFLSPDGEQLYVTYPYLSTVSIIDTETFSEVMAISIRAPRGIAFNSKGTKAYIASTDNADASFSPGTVQQLNTTTFKIENTYKVGVGPSDVYVLYSDQFVIVNNYEGQSISKIDTVSGDITTTKLNGRPSGISLVN